MNAGAAGGRSDGARRIRGRQANRNQYQEYITQMTNPRFTLDETTAVPVEELGSQGHRFVDDRQGALFA